MTLFKTRPKWKGRWEGWSLAATLVLALVLRLESIRFGLPALNDPDELMFELGALRMLRGLTLNPGWFGHPATITMYALAVVNILVFVTGWLVGWFPSLKAFEKAIYADPSWMILPGRILMTLFALGTLILTYRLATRLAGRRTGLIAAAMLSISPVHVTYSQIIRSDMMACFFLLLVLLSALDIAERDRRRDYVLAALWLGLAITTKWPFALAALAVGGAVMLLRNEGRLEWRSALLRLVAFGAMGAAFVFILSPYLLLDYPTVVRNLTGEGQAHHLGSTGGTFGQNALWYLTGPLLTGLSVIGLVLVPVGTFVLWQNRRARALLIPVALGFFLVLSMQSMVWERWGLPLLPLCAIAAAAGLCTITDGLTGHWRSTLAGVLLAAIAIPLLLRTNADARERLNDTRQIAARWAKVHIPAGSSVLIEHFAFDLLPQPWHFLFPLGDAGCVDAVAMLHGKVSYAPIDKARGTRSNVDYGTMAPARRDSCKADFAILTQYDRYFRERSRFPAEYAAYRDLIAKGRIVAEIRPEPGRAGGRVVTIVAFGPARR